MDQPLLVPSGTPPPPQRVILRSREIIIIRGERDAQLRDRRTSVTLDV